MAEQDLDWVIAAINHDNNSDFEWYCPFCDVYLYPEEVTFEETHDKREGGCGHPVQGEQDKNEGEYDTLEEKNL